MAWRLLSAAVVPCTAGAHRHSVTAESHALNFPAQIGRSVGDIVSPDEVPRLMAKPRSELTLASWTPFAHQRHRTPSLRRSRLRMVDANAGHGFSRGARCQASAHVVPDRRDGFTLDRQLVLDSIFADLQQDLSDLIRAGVELQFIE